MKQIEEFHSLNRSELKEILLIEIKKPLTLVVAPVGYGKTTVVYSVLSEIENKLIINISAGRNEMDSGAVWMHFIEEAKKLDFGFYEQIKDSNMPVAKHEILFFINELKNHINMPTYLIIDNYHICQSKYLNRLLTQLAYADIPDLHMIIISREFPEMAFEELVVKRKCGFIGKKMFTLSKNEISQIFLSNKIKLSENDLEKIYNYTDGWISAVYLVFLEHSAVGGFNISNGITNLLKTSLLDRLSEPVKDLLYKMSLFDSFTIEEACYVTDNDMLGTALERLVRNMGFIRYDSAEGKFYMHALLKLLAEEELRKSGADINTIYKRYADISEANGNYGQAVFAWEKSGDIEKILSMIEEHIHEKVLEKIPAIINKVFDNVDMELCVKYPFAYISYLRFLLMGNERSKGIELFNERKDIIRESCDGKPEGTHITIELYILESITVFNDLEATNSCLRRACSLLQGQDITLQSIGVMTYGAPDSLVLWYREPGTLKKIVEQEKEYSKYYVYLTKNVNSMLRHIFDAEYAYITGDYKKAEHDAGISLEIARFRGQLCVIISAYYVIMRCAVCSGDVDLFNSSINDVKSIIKDCDATLVMDYELVRGHLFSLIGRLEEIPDWITDLKMDVGNYMVNAIRSSSLSYGITLIHQEKWAMLDALSDYMLTPSGTARHVYVKIHGLIFKTIAAYNMKDIETARMWLNEALERARFDELRMPFAEMSRYIKPVLKYFSVEDKFVCSIMELCSVYDNGISRFQSSEGKREQNKGILTERESEIIMLVEQGYKNIEIAKSLHIAQITVDKALTNVYRKLGVTNRAAAVAKIKNMRKQSEVQNNS